ncbi:hypothetical protein DM860_016763 [Cuscuta australis]|uniref:Uncharacterized protein n=1 Tax=Cuscuta australis TaxID=267555 RepID=A0A328DAG9_9ASTE|nr:hypothetical protein DM860_016763 [Cuscuta australis]
MYVAATMAAVGITVDSDCGSVHRCNMGMLAAMGGEKVIVKESKKTKIIVINAGQLCFLLRIPQVRFILSQPPPISGINIKRLSPLQKEKNAQ